MTLREMIDSLKPAVVVPIRKATRKARATRTVSWLDSTGKAHVLRKPLTLADARFEVKRLNRLGFQASHGPIHMAEVA